MTPEQRAEVLRNEFPGYWQDDFTLAVAAAIREAVLTERERCARVARQQLVRTEPDDAEDIAYKCGRNESVEVIEKAIREGK